MNNNGDKTGVESGSVAYSLGKVLRQSMCERHTHIPSLASLCVYSFP